MSPRSELVALLDRVRRRWRGAATLRAIARGAGGVAAVVLAAAAADWWLAPRDLPLVALGALAAAGAAAVLAWAFWPLGARPSDRQVARYVEERCPELEDRLASATDPASATGPFGALVVADAAARARAIEPARVVSPEALAQAAWRAAGAVALLVLSGAVGWAPAGRVVSAGRMHLLPGALTLEVEPGDARVAAGSAFRVRARLAGPPRSFAGVSPTVTVTSGGSSDTAAMAADREGFALEIPSVTASFTYRVRAGRAESPEYAVTALFPPRVQQVDVSYEYPPFTGLGPRTEEDGGDIFAPAGTRVRLRVRADKPLRGGDLVMSDGRHVALDLAGEAVVEGGLEVAADGSYRVALADADGLAGGGDTEYFIRVMDDRPPDVRILRPAGDRSVTPLEEVPIEARADDDFGLAAFELVYAVRGGDEQVVPLAGGGAATSRTASHLLYLEDLGVEPGDFISYYARARDVARGRRARESRSDIYFLEVTPFDAEFEMATSQAGGAGAGATSVDSLVRAQKDVISATWTLDRRQQGGRSAADIKAVARAQGELKAQADAAAAGPLGAARRRGNEGRSEAIAGEPMVLAAAAMGRAESELDALDTGGALPHEMEALNQLLRAQAEIRRRQISRQRGAGAGGSARADRDLSALFDRELQRQQETSYEAPAPPEAGRPDEPDALDEIRELARRQNDLSRQQRDLAEAGLDAEELKRQLERLTREQNDLRQRAEELARRMERQPGQRASGEPGQQGQASGAQSGGQALSGVADEMRGASSDLRRQDLDSAAARGERAAEALEALGERLGGGRPGDEGRPLGELQIEAREMADAQARLADQAAEAGQPGGAATARRRLAGEQARLADRADRLERSAAALGGSSGAAGERMAEALAEIEQADLSRRMREAAGQLAAGGTDDPVGERGEAAARDGADATRRIAESMARVAGALETALPGAAADEIGALGERLARARALADRLDALEREIERVGRDLASRPSGEAAGAEPSAELARLQEQYARALRDAGDLLDEMRRSGQAPGRGLSPEAHQYTMGAPGTEAFKQDYSRWESLRREAGLAIERYESEVSARLAAALAEARLSAGIGQDVPEAYRALVAKYYEALAKKRR